MKTATLALCFSRQTYCTSQWWRDKGKVLSNLYQKHIIDHHQDQGQCDL